MKVVHVVTKIALLLALILPLSCLALDHCPTIDKIHCTKLPGYSWNCVANHPGWEGLIFPQSAHGSAAINVTSISFAQVLWRPYRNLKQGIVHCLYNAKLVFPSGATQNVGIEFTPGAFVPIPRPRTWTIVRLRPPDFGGFICPYMSLNYCGFTLGS